MGPTRSKEQWRPYEGTISATLLIYVDDAILARDDKDQYLADLEQFFAVIEKYGMTLHTEKCKFGRSGIKYLGFLVGGHGMKVDPKNIECGKKFQPPTDLIELRSFTGAVSYFRRFIRGFSGIMKPLHGLTTKRSVYGMAH